VGNLGFKLTWDIEGDVDLVVVSPTGKTISYLELGPSADTDYGALDVDSFDRGPENIFWDDHYTPPSGTYHVFVWNYQEVPVNFVLSIRTLGSSSTTSGQASAESKAIVCSTSDPSFVKSFTFPAT
jgi:uncharacterized protein YfaP (DUF2135 family)